MIQYDIENDDCNDILVDNRVHATSIALKFVFGHLIIFSEDSTLIALGNAQGYILVYRNDLTRMTVKRIHDFVVTNLKFIGLNEIVSCSLDETVQLSYFPYKYNSKNYLF